jgi:hypothetical protein
MWLWTVSKNNAIIGSCIQDGEFVYRRVSVALARPENTPPSRSHDESHNVNPINTTQKGLRGQNFGLSDVF